jgi:F-type H+-transporting ATPase subunit epsilon
MLHARRHGGRDGVSPFVLHLQDAFGSERVDDVESFVGADASGSFGLLAGHARFMTSLTFGLARFRRAGQDWEYLALPGALVYFVDDALDLNTRRYFRDPDYRRISALLRERLAEEERDLEATRESLHRLEGEILKRLWELGRGREPAP